MVEEHPERHEHRDANVRAVALFGAGLLASIALVMLGILAFLSFLSSKPPGSIGPLADLRLEPPAPRLQVSPELDLQKLRTEEDQVLSSYGWVDEKAGVARIPIDRAMDLLAQRGLPVRGQAGGKK